MNKNEKPKTNNSNDPLLDNLSKLNNVGQGTKPDTYVYSENDEKTDVNNNFSQKNDP